MKTDWRAPPSFGLLPLLLALLAGCGPTTGGTGTGEGAITVASFGASATSTCSAPFAGALACGTTSLAPASPAQLPGTAPVVFVGDGASGAYVLTMQDNHALLQSRCSAARFEGEFGLLPGGEARFLGGWTGAGQAATWRAQLWLQAVPGRDDALLLQVLDADGRALLGPLSLRRVAAVPTEAPACP